MSAGAPASILIVEDEAIITLDLEQMVAELGYSVAGTASSADEALELARTTSPDLVLMDINMGEAPDGTMAAMRLHLAGGPPVVFVTAYDDERTLARAKYSEPFGYILKPFSLRELRVVIEMALYHARMQREREVLAQRLRGALTEITKLQQMLRMCSYCRRVADEQGGWTSIERYLEERTGTTVSHGMCPDCSAKLSQLAAGGAGGGSGADGGSGGA